MKNNETNPDCSHDDDAQSCDSKLACDSHAAFSADNGGCSTTSCSESAGTQTQHADSTCKESSSSGSTRKNSAKQTCGDAVPELTLPRERRQNRPWENSELEARVEKAETADQLASDTIGNTGAAAKDERIPRRWDRLVRLVGENGVRKLLNSHVTVFGLGGVGSYAVEALTRSAIGHLTIVDFDDVCVTNVNRQLQAFPGTVGQSKANLLAQRVKAINPNADVDAVQAFYDPTTSKALLTPRPDFVIDAIDNVTAKLHLLETCMRQEIPVISIAGAGARLDPTMVRVDDLSKTRNDPLARIMRKEFSRRGFDLTSPIGLPVVFSQEEPLEPETPTWDADGFRCICPHAEDSPHACEKRRVIYGTASFMTAAFAMAATSVVIKRLTGLG